MVRHLHEKICTKQSPKPTASDGTAIENGDVGTVLLSQSVANPVAQVDFLMSYVADEAVQLYTSRSYALPECACELCFPLCSINRHTGHKGSQQQPAAARATASSDGSAVVTGCIRASIECIERSGAIVIVVLQIDFKSESALMYCAYPQFVWSIAS